MLSNDQGVPTGAPLSFAIYIPAKNVAATILTVIARIPPELLKSTAEIIVVDNASTDETPRLIADYIRTQPHPPLHYIRHESDAGYGGSQKAAYLRVIEMKHDAVAMVHGDGQYAPEVLGELLEVLRTKKCGMVFGSRMTGDPLSGGMPLYRFIANKFLTRVENLLLGTNLSEFHSGYRVYSGEALRKINFENCSNDYHFDTDIIIELVDKNLPIGEVTIPTHYGKESKSISFVHSIFYGVNVLLSAFFYRLKK